MDGRSYSAAEAAMQSARVADKEGGERSLIGAAWGSFTHTLLQQPVESLAQLSDHAFGTDLAKHVHIAETPRAASFGSKEWVAQQIGGGVGMIAPFMLVNEGVGRLLGGAGEATQTAESLTLGDYARNSMLRARNLGLAGSTYSLLFTPATADGGDFWLDKIKGAGVSGVTFAGMGAASYGLRGAAESLAGRAPAVSRVLGNEVVSSGLSGIPGGFLNAELGSLSSGKGFASGDEIAHQMLTYSVLGAGFAAGHAGIERATASGGGEIAGSNSVEPANASPKTVTPNEGAKYASDTTLDDGTRIIEHWDGKRITIAPGRKPVVEYPEGHPALLPKSAPVDQPARPAKPVEQRLPVEPDYSWMPIEERPINIGSRSGSQIEQEMSNFAHTPFTLDGKEYASVEGFYVALKHSHDPVKAEQAASLWGYEAKKFGRSSDATTATYNGQTFELGSPEHHALVKRAIQAKLEQHPEIARAFAETYPRPIIHDLGYPESPNTRLPGRDFARILTELRNDLIR